MMCEGYFNDFNGNMPPDCQPAMKRKRRDSEEFESSVCSGLIKGRSFLPIQKDSGIFCTEDWKETGTALYCPLKHDLYINMTKYDQVSAAEGSFFTADEAGQFSKSVTGHVLHLWRYDKLSRKLFVCQSFLFTDFQDFVRVQSFLQNL